MNFEPLTDDAIRAACRVAGIDPVTSITKILIGFSNDVYDVNGQYILKASRTDDDDEVDLRKEIYLCNLVRDVVPAPTIVYADESRTALDRVYIVYKKIEGENLYPRWGSYTDSERRGVIRQICTHIKALAAVPYDEFVSRFALSVPTDWEAFTVSRIDECVAKARAQGALPDDLAVAIERFVAAHRGSLRESSLVLLYADPHFDNFIVRDAEVVGMLDFECMSVRSIDWVLHLVDRMVREPKKYASDVLGETLDPTDYAHLLDWYREFYPELFAFPDMDSRLKLYAIQHNLSDLVGWPHVESLRENLRQIVSV